MTPAELRAAVDRCVACAACRSGCPTFDATLEEGRSGRGRVQLVRSALDGALDPGTERFRELLVSCTRCGYCASICPVGIPVVDVIDAGRALADARHGGAPPARPTPAADAERAAAAEDVRWLLERVGADPSQATVDDPARWCGALSRAGLRGPFLGAAPAGPFIVHDPCSARFGPAGRTGALELLIAAGFDARAFAGATCCGGAEPFRSDAPRLAEELGRRAAEAARAAGAAAFVTSDAACLIQFRAAFAARPPHPTVLHVATALRRRFEPAPPP